MEHFDLVQKSYDELRASGAIVPVAPGPDQERAVEEQKAFLTRRAAWYLFNVDNGYGLLSKTSGNNVGGLSVDITLHKPEGTAYDIATDIEVGGGARMAAPVNAGGNIDTSLLPRWVQPTAELAGLPDDGNGNGNGEPPDDDIMAKLDEMQGQIEAGLHKQDMMQEQLNLQTALLNQMAAVLDQILNKPVPPGGKFPIIYPNYAGRVLGFTVVLNPQPRENP